MLDEKIEFGKLYQQDVEEYVNSDALVRQLKHDVQQNWGYRSLVTPSHFIDYFSLLDNDFSLVNSEGRLAVRISRRLKNIHGISLSSEHRSAIGNTIRQYSIREGVVQISFSRACEWKAGHFGDGSSCFFGGRTSTGRMLLNNDKYFALRFHELGQDLDFGVGRILIKECPYWYALFNAYGPYPGNLAAKYFSLFLHGDVTMKSLHLTNFGRDSGSLWINLSGRGFLVPRPANKNRKLPERYDLRTKVSR